MIVAFSFVFTIVVMFIPRAIAAMVTRWRVRRDGFPRMNRRQLVLFAVDRGVTPRWWESSRRLRARVRQHLLNTRRR